MKIAFYTLGCKLNQAETGSLVAEFNEAGFQIVPPDNLADIYIANTCTVTHIADRKSRHWLRLAKRRNPQALIIATGAIAKRLNIEIITTDMTRASAKSRFDRADKYIIWK